MVTGSTPPTSDKQNYTSNDVCFVKPSDIGQDGITDIQETEFHISEYAYNNTNRKLPKGSVLVTCIGIIGKVGILTKEATCNQQINAVIPNSTIMPRYLAYCIYSIRKALQDKANAPVVPILNKGQFSSFQIPVPPLPVQQQICSLLDKLSRVIEAKKEQLKELDNLSQAIFYDMFGDPVNNPQGWEVKQFGDECTELRYGTSRPASENGKYKYLRMGNLTTSGHLDLNDIKTIDIPDCEVDKCLVKYGDVLFNRTNSLDLIGKTCMFDLEEPMIIAGYLIRIRLSARLTPRYVSVTFNMPSMKKLLRNMAKGAVNQANINSKELASIRIPVPPLPLQQSFAEKVEAIERQKKLINQSIREVQTLFDSRMDYWFSD